MNTHNAIILLITSSRKQGHLIIYIWSSNFELLSKDGNITPEKARKSRQMQFHNKTAYVWMRILPLKKRVNRDKCSFATKQRMFGVFAIDEILRYRGTRFPGSRTLCHPAYEHKNLVRNEWIYFYDAFILLVGRTPDHCWEVIVNQSWAAEQMLPKPKNL